MVNLASGRATYITTRFGGRRLDLLKVSLVYDHVPLNTMGVALFVAVSGSDMVFPGLALGAKYRLAIRAQRDVIGLQMPDQY